MAESRPPADAGGMRGGVPYVGRCSASRCARPLPLGLRPPLRTGAAPPATPAEPPPARRRHKWRARPPKAPARVRAGPDRLVARAPSAAAGAHGGGRRPPRRAYAPSGGSAESLGCDLCRYSEGERTGANLGPPGGGGEATGSCAGTRGPPAGPSEDRVVGVGDARASAEDRAVRRGGGRSGGRLGGGGAGEHQKRGGEGGGELAQGLGGWLC